MATKINNKTKTIKTINSFFAIGFFLILIAVLAKSIVKPKDILSSENRYAERYSSFSVEGYLDKSVQDNIEKTLSDQIFISEKLRAANNFVEANIIKKYIDIFLDDDDVKYLKLDKISLFDKYTLVYPYKNLDELKADYDDKIANYNSVIKNYPDIDIYFYYIEKDTDINFRTGEKIGAYEYLKERLNTKNIARFKINNFDEFKEYFYRTDHHWNYKGSYKAYQQILKMLGSSDQPLEGEEVNTHLKWSGSKAKSSIFSKVIVEDFIAYDFNFPEIKITVNGKENNYGAQKDYLNGTLKDSITYGKFYGNDYGEVIFNTPNNSKENILVIGESYDNAILRLLASHYNKTISIDLRYYEHYMNKKFNLAAYLKEYNISKVLFIGNIDFYTLPKFLIREVK